jgi:hypothetical protein
MSDTPIRTYVVIIHGGSGMGEWYRGITVTAVDFMEAARGACLELVKMQKRGRIISMVEWDE